MKSSSAFCLQLILVLIGIGALTFLLGEPHLEGRNVHATLFQIYFKDPFLAYVYVGSTPFFVALYRGFGLLGDVRQKGAFSQATVDALRSIKHCAIILIGFVAGGVVLIALFGDKEDRPAGLFMSLLATLVASATVFAAARSARHVQRTLKRPEGSPR